MKGLKTFAVVWEQVVRHGKQINACTDVVAGCEVRNSDSKELIAKTFAMLVRMVCESWLEEKVLTSGERTEYD